MQRKSLLIIFFCIFPFFVNAQVLGERKTFTIDGYIKDLQTIQMANLDNITTYNLIHNRINTQLNPVENFSAVLEMRNRIYYGEFVKNLNNLTSFSDFISENNDVYDMSYFWLEKKAVVAHSVFDRAYLNYSHSDVNIRLGRQRINWGINLVWNPNDIFNTYSFFDFDYEERPGSDALRFQYYTGFASRLEIAVKAFKDIEEIVAAGMYKWNVKSYDIQVLGGVYRKDITIGAGWAGNIKNAGLKGEVSYFQPYEHLTDTTGVFTGSATADYSFRNGLSMSGSVLYNSNGSTDANTQNLIQYDISPKNLLPYKYAGFVRASYPFTPLLNGSLATMYSPTNNSLFLFPQLTISIDDNWDLDLISQLLFADQNGKYQDVGKYFFTRVTWSY